MRKEPSHSNKDGKMPWLRRSHFSCNLITKLWLDHKMFSPKCSLDGKKMILCLRNHSYFLRASTQVLDFEKWCEEKGAKWYHKKFHFQRAYELHPLPPSYWSENWGLKMLSNLLSITEVRKLWNENLQSFLRAKTADFSDTSCESLPSIIIFPFQLILKTLG